MSTKYTPGPWVVEFSRSGYPYSVKAINGDDKQLGAVGKSVLRWASISLPSCAEGQANARLIAAAPCMAKEIESAIRRLDWFLDANPDHLDSTLNVIRQDLRAVYAKATGSDQ